MTGKTILKIVAASALALTTLSGCATGFKAQVSRFQQLPPAQGESFTVVAEDGAKAGGLEFGHYADIVSQQMSRYGYKPAADPASAQLVVRVDYVVDQGRERIRSTGGFGGGFGGGWGGGPFGYGGYYPGGFGWRGRYMYGFNDPFMFGGGFDSVDSYTVYSSKLMLRIDRAGTGKALFEGTASAQSLSNRLTYLVPNLIDALFTGFPGNSGEDVKVTLAPEPKK